MEAVKDFFYFVVVIILLSVFPMVGVYDYLTTKGPALLMVTMVTAGLLYGGIWVAFITTRSE